MGYTHLSMLIVSIRPRCHSSTSSGDLGDAYWKLIDGFEKRSSGIESKTIEQPEEKEFDESSDEVCITHLLGNSLT